MKKLLLLALTSLQIQNSFGYTYTVINQTRGIINVLPHYIGGKGALKSVNPESVYKWSIGSCLNKITITGASHPVANLKIDEYKVQGNKCHTRQFFVRHINPKYVKAKGQMITGSNKPRLAIYQDSGSLGIKQR